MILRYSWRIATETPLAYQDCNQVYQHPLDTKPLIHQIALDSPKYADKCKPAENLGGIELITGFAQFGCDGIW